MLAPNNYICKTSAFQNIPFEEKKKTLLFRLAPQSLGHVNTSVASKQFGEEKKEEFVTTQCCVPTVARHQKPTPAR